MNRRNSEGYSDPTAYSALTKIEHEEKQVRKLKAALCQVCEVAGYSLKGQVIFTDKRTGHIYKL